MNLVTLLLDFAGRAPESAALRAERDTVTFGALAESVQRVAGGLSGLGVEPGDRVAIVVANRPAFVVAYVATLWAGGVAVPLNPTAAPRELARELDGVDARLALIGPAGREAFVAAGTTTPAVGVDCVLDGRADITWETLCASEPRRGPAERDDEDLAVLLHTAGTAGAPKAAMLSHGNLASNIRQVQDRPSLRVEPDDVGFGVLPFFHIYGLNAGLGVTLAAGACQVLVPEFDPAGSLALLHDERVTIIAGVPAMYEAWLEVADAPTDSFASVRLALSGAAPLPPEITEEMHDRFGVALYQGYGLTEASPVVTSSSADGAYGPGSIGPPLSGVEVRLVDAEGRDVLTGDPGELWVRGPNVFSGYWNDPEATGQVLTSEGWLRTGDIAVADEAGSLSLVDRAKDLVIVSGFNVFPAEVESVLTEHPAVAEAAVIGAPSKRGGEAVVAFVVVEAGAEVTADELRDFCSGKLARYKIPARIEVTDDLPRNLAGKLLRRALRTRLGTGS